MKTNQYIDEIVNIVVALSQEVECEDPIDWGMLAINEEDTYRLIATSVIEEFKPRLGDMNETAITMLAVITKLTVENFVLNLKLLEGAKNGG